MSRPPARPTLAQAARLVARALGLSVDELNAGFRVACESDLPAMMALRQRVLGAKLDADDGAYLSWRYRLGRPDKGGGDCWVLTRGQELLGMVGAQELVLRCGGLSCPAWSLMDVLIAPELEGSGLGVWLNLAMQARAPATLAIGSNPHSIGLVKRLFEPLPNRNTYVHPVRLGHFLRRRWGAWAFASGAAAVSDALLVLLRAALLAPWRGRVAVRRLERFGDEVQALDAQSGQGPLVHGERSASSLNWRLLESPRGPCDLWGAWSAGRLQAYAATCLRPLGQGRQALIVADVLVGLPQDKAALRALLWTVCQHARRQGADYVSVTSCRHDLEAELRRAGFRRQGHAYETLGWTCRNEHFAQQVSARADWTLSELHTDRI